MRFFYYAASSLRRARSRSRGLALLLAVTAAAAAGCSSGGRAPAGAMGTAASASQRELAANPEVDPGSSLGGVQAPGFTLTDQFGRPVSLSSYRGKVVIIAFTDSECTTVCPITTQSLLAAKDLLGKAGSNVQLVGIDANPGATAVSDVLGYSQSHGMVNHWEFLTGSLPQLKSVWKSYNIAVQVEQGDIDHTPAVYVIDPQGRERELYLTQMNYASIAQAGEVMAQEASSLLPGHPPLVKLESLAHISGLGPAKSAKLPVLPSGSLTLAPGKPHLLVFFATWLQQTTDLSAELTGLNQYAKAAGAGALPRLTAVDEETSEPSASAVTSYVAGLHGSLTYPVALDTDGRLADGYGVQDQPWFALTSPDGKIIWHHDGWLPASQLTAAVRAATAG